MADARNGQTATLLQDGRVLIAGGSGDSTAELYDPKTVTFGQTGPMNVARTVGATATLLQDGRVLIAGGSDSSVDQKPLASAELYDPRTDTFGPTGSMARARSGHTATLLQDGRVLLVGGLDSSSGILATAELYDPKTGKFVSTGSMSTGRYTGHTATLLQDGRVLLVGGNASSVQEKPLAAAELYDPETSKFVSTGPMAEARDGQTATLLLDGRVLIAGGADNTAELYDPKAGVFGPTGSMVESRASHSATLLADGRVLIAGGASDPAAGASAELYQP
jgi:WD40 repeat protein